MIQKKDFVEIKYIAKIKDDGVFDTNIKEEAEKINLNISSKPLIICIGEKMILPAVDEFLVGKEIGKEYSIELEPEKAFGERRKELVKIMPISVFREKNITPQTGKVFSFDNFLGKINAVSGGRVIVDFNHPLAGKTLIYNLKLKRKITEEKEKIKSLMIAYFGKEFDFEVKEKKLIIKTDGKEDEFIKLFSNKFKDILNLEVEIAKKQ